MLTIYVESNHHWFALTLLSHLNGNCHILLDFKITLVPWIANFSHILSRHTATFVKHSSHAHTHFTWKDISSLQQVISIIWTSTSNRNFIGRRWIVEKFSLNMLSRSSSRCHNGKCQSSTEITNQYPEPLLSVVKPYAKCAGHLKFSLNEIYNSKSELLSDFGLGWSQCFKFVSKTNFILHLKKLDLDFS